jgi:hypothetical protein
MLQPGWRADNAVQGLGRTHRTNQAAPTYRLVEIDDLKARSGSSAPSPAGSTSSGP